MTSFPMKILKDGKGYQELGDDSLVYLCSERDVRPGDDLLTFGAHLARAVRTEVLVGTSSPEGCNDVVAKFRLQA
jgi:hypothetical protein